MSLASSLSSVEPDTTVAAAAAQRGTSAQRVRSVVLLHGSGGASEFATAVGRSLLDLPIGEAMTVLGLWKRQLESLAAGDVEQGPEARLVLDRSSALPDGCGRWPLRVQRDPLELRGTGGVLHDVTSDCPDDSLVLVAAAAQVLLSPLGRLIEQLSAPRADVAMFVHDDGSPGGLMLVRRGCLDLIPRIGFFDLKEQALPRIAAAGSVAVVRASSPVTASIRTADRYLHALRVLHGESASFAGAGAFAEQWRAAFQIVETGASVGTKTSLHDSVVLDGATVGRGATLIRCVVGPTGVVSEGATVVDEVVG